MSSRSAPFWLLIAALGIGVFLFGCDQVSPSDERQPPTMSGLEITPDSVRAADLPPNRVSESDSVAAVEFEISAQAVDPDGRVDRVVFTFEPSSNPRSTFSGTLSSAGDGEYRWQERLGLPLLDEVYTIRAFAVDDDSLASNQVVGRFRFIAE